MLQLDWGVALFCLLYHQSKCAVPGGTPCSAQAVLLEFDAYTKGHHIPLFWRDKLPWEPSYVFCCMCFAKAPEAHCRALKCQLLEVHTAGPQGGDQEPV